MWRWLLVLVVACSGRGGGSGKTAAVFALAGGAPEPQATVVSHRADGTILDEQLADPTGRADVAVEAGARISVVFPAASTQASSISIITTMAPAPGGSIDIYGPPDPSGPPTVIGTLTIAPQQPITADAYDVALGCIVLHLPSLSQVIDVASTCAGSDTNLDVLVTATSGGALAGYAAGRVSIADGGAVFQPAQWDPMPGSIPITLDGVAPALDWVLWSDGLPFAAQPLTGTTAPVWNGLVVDSATVHATIASGPSSQVTTRELAGMPTAIAFAATDFLPSIAQTLAQDPGTGLAVHWAAASPGADALDLRLSWTSGMQRVVWDSVLPPDATATALPALGGNLSAPAAPPDALLRYLDGPAATSFSDVAAGGIHVEDPDHPSTIVTPPSSGDIRETDASGFAP